MLALGFCNSESVGMLLEEVQPLIDDYSSTRTSVSAQALEVCSATMGPLHHPCLSFNFYLACIGVSSLSASAARHLNPLMSAAAGRYIQQHV